MNVSNDPDFNKIMNLIRFNINFSKFIRGNDPLSQSPDYILEKYNHWIGFEPTVDHKMYTPDSMIDFFNKYWKVWRPDTNQINSKLKNILMYLYSTQNMNLLLMSEKFQEYIGSLEMIHSYQIKDLHEVTERVSVPTLIDKNKENIIIVLRDLKISNLV